MTPNIQNQEKQLLHKFIETESLNKAGSEAEQKVWNACKKGADSI